MNWNVQYAKARCARCIKQHQPYSKEMVSIQQTQNSDVNCITYKTINVRIGVV